MGSTIIGIHGGHDASVTVLKEGCNVFSMGEERLSRQKNHFGFPHLALHYIFENNIVTADEIQVIASSSSIMRQDETEYSEQEKIPYIRKVFADLGCHDIDVQIHDHHLAHTASAYYGFTADKALIVTSDGSGDGLSNTICVGANGKIERLYASSFKETIGFIYGGVTSKLGYRYARHEGKVTGLAAYGNGDKFKQFLHTLRRVENGEIKARKPYPQIQKNLTSVLSNYLKLNPIRLTGFLLYTIWHLYVKKRPMVAETEYDFFEKRYTPEDLSAGVQGFTEEILCDWIAYWVKKTGIKRVALAGGVFANVKVNQRITERCGVDEIFIYPNMSDGGLSYGVAALAYYENHAYNPKQNITDTMYLGPEYTDAEILQCLKQDNNVTFEKSKNIAHDVAELVVNRTIVGWFQGKMEFGPRALGARSVVAMADDATINDWLNQRMQRTEFMPFAPSVLAEHMDDVFYIEKDGFKRPSEYMTITYDVKEKWRHKIAAVNHVDNTARPQMVSKKTNKLYYNMLSHVYDKTGIPLTINTSFNVHEEPIVMTPADALNALHRGMVDVVAMGSYLVRVKEN